MYYPYDKAVLCLSVKELGFSDRKKDKGYLKNTYKFPFPNIWEYLPNKFDASEAMFSLPKIVPSDCFSGLLQPWDPSSLSFGRA